MTPDPAILHALLTEQLTTLLSAPLSPEVEAELDRVLRELLELENAQ